MRPEFGNSKIKIYEDITTEQKIEAAAWLNVTDEDLRKKLVEYFADPKNANINIQLSRKTGEGYNKVKVAVFNLFVNTPKEEKEEDDTFSV
tara:strand:+ start:1068 stop:1340 length:273 start_codon:yes stop_codon:yes gene_type:complete